MQSNIIYISSLVLHFPEEINYTKKCSIAKRPLDMRLNSSFFEKKINIRTKNTLSEVKLIIKDYI